MKTGIFRKCLFTALMLSVIALPLSSFCADNPPGKKKQPAKDYSPYPPPGSGYVTDNAGLLNKEQEERIEKWLWQAESKTGIEIVVVTIYSIKDYKGTANSSIESFAKGLFDKYGIGDKQKNNGILLLVASKDRKVRIELGKHYGRSRDDDASHIVQNVIIPEFKKDNYADGITEGVKAILEEFAGLRVSFPWSLVIIPLAIVVLGLIAYSLFKNGKKGWGWVVIGIIVILVLALIRIIFTISRHMPKGSSSGWSSGGFGGGFGGGSSGGGGATGSW